MGEILIASPYITRTHIEGSLGELRQFSPDEFTSELIMRATQEITEVDILVIGYFIVFKKQLPQLNILLVLPQNTTLSRISETLKQYMAYAYMSTGESVFSVQFGTSAPEFVNKDRRTGAFPKSWYIFSRVFMPPIFIGKDSGLYEQFFQPRRDKENALLRELEGLPYGVKYNPSNAELITEIKRTITDNIDTYNPERCMHGLAMIAFYQILDRARVTNIYFDSNFQNTGEKRKDILAGNLISEDAYTYFDSVKSLVDEVREAPVMHQYLYAILLSSELLPGSLNAETQKKFRDALFNLWDFSKDLIKGIRELAKNILEHALPPIGVVTCRVYDENSYKVLAGTDPGKNSFIKRYNAKSPDNVTGWIEINVVDLGERGVVDTIHENTLALLRTIKKEEDKEDNVKNMITSDLERMEAGKVTFQHILNPSLDTILNQQCKRSIAHFGLLTLTSLIKNNGGLLLAGTWRANNVESAVRDFVVLPGTEKQKDYAGVAQGTCYQIVLPVDSTKEYQPFHAHPVSNQQESSATDIKDVEELFRFEVIDLKPPLSAPLLKKSVPYLVNIDFGEVTVRTRMEENQLASRLISLIKETEDKNPGGRTYIPCINFDTIRMDASQLFRFLGYWENYYPSVSIVINNLQTDVFFDLTRINKDFAKLAPTLDYWNGNAVTIVYSYVPIPFNDVAEPAKRFYFADCLWGSSDIDYIKLNRMIHRTNFNATSLFTLDQEKINILANDTSAVNVSNCPAFFNDNVLLPFDLLLKGKDDITVFEHNIRVLLENEIEP